MLQLANIEYRLSLIFFFYLFSTALTKAMCAIFKTSPPMLLYSTVYSGGWNNLKTETSAITFAMLLFRSCHLESAVCSLLISSCPEVKEKN